MNKKPFFGLSIIASLILLLTGCMGAGEQLVSQTERNEAPMTEPAVQSQPADDRGTTSGESPGRVTANEKQSPQSADQISIDKKTDAETEPSKPLERKIIRNADLQLESSSPDEVHQKITAIAENKKGFVVQSRKSNSEARNRGGETVMMTIRVPAEEFNQTITEIRKTANRVVDESVSGNDVTEEFIDIEARLKAKKALEERFLAIMEQSRSVQDALNVQRELANVRSEIERIEGRKKFLENQASLSTIKINIRTPVALSGSSSGFIYEFKQAVSDGFNAALSFILILIRVLIALIPFLILIVLPLLLVLRYIWRQYKKRRQAKKFADEINAEVEKEVIDITKDEN
ncbi:MAG: DUF4349 domain-containing protein [Pyrinomonadaceae bacterium]